MTLLNEGRENPMALFVGGCVRNALIGAGTTDIDIATIHTPQQTTEILSADGIQVIPTGVDHGTVTAVIDSVHYEITTLRRDVETTGRHAVVAFTADWREDAMRRDFTMNTLLADCDGNVYEPLGLGVEDAKSGRVVFVGEAEERIKEDYLRILRFFRFHAFY
ncbi:MAG: CCA tRNA nucleotidyltransferase, partial [Pseudomonadota bacterium]|nr:CCA tRNA nucleotidyltransferase [Pseudomonadota bacterium]